MPAEHPAWEQGRTPILPPAQLEAIGYAIAAYPLTLLSAAMRAMQEALADLKAGRPPQRLLSFEEVKTVVGFPDYYAEEARYGAGEA